MGWMLEDMPRQAGRLAVVTGATGGLGFECAAALAAAGGEVIVAARDASKGEAAVAGMRARRPAGSARFEPLDLNALASVRAFAAAREAEGRPVDLLVNNAGVMGGGERRVSADGFEQDLAVNHLGHFALTGLLLPLLRRSASGARVVSVSSLTHARGRLDFDDLQSERYAGLRAYARSKAAVLMFARALARWSEAGGWGVRSVAAHPGWARTRLMQAGAPGGRGLIVAGASIVEPLLAQSAARGALSLLYAATAPEAENGGYYGPQGVMEMKGPPGPAKVAGFIDDRAAQDRLWRDSERLTGVAFA